MQRLLHCPQRRAGAAIAMDRQYAELDPPVRLLLGPGPSNPEPRVLRAMAAPLLGQFDPLFTAMMNDVVELQRYVFQTANERCFPVSGSSRAALEAAIASLVEPGDRVLIGNCGRFGDLMALLARRAGAEVREVRAEWGRIIEPEQVAAELAAFRPKVVLLVHGETSTGMLQPLEEISRLTRRDDALLVVDAVVSLGGVELAVDWLGIDVCTSGLQKCLGGPSGLSPLTYNERAEAAMNERRSAISSNYLDLPQLARYWSAERWNHHTAPTSMVYALREALRLISLEGLEARVARHRAVGEALCAGLEAMGLELFGDRQHALPVITPIVIPAGVDDQRTRTALLEEFGIEIGASFGPLQGRVWRIGTMGYNARPSSVLTLLGALESVLATQGYRAAPGAAVEAAARRLRVKG
jgi:(S)-ureidoglycine---glyoxylate transaminase